MKPAGEPEPAPDMSDLDQAERIYFESRMEEIDAAAEHHNGLHAQQTAVMRKLIEQVVALQSRVTALERALSGQPQVRELN